MTELITIHPAQLTTVSGGADARRRLLSDALDNRFSDDGAVKLLDARFTPAGHGLSRASGRVDINALSGGDTKRSFTADVDARHHRVTNLHTKLISFE